MPLNGNQDVENRDGIDMIEMIRSQNIELRVNPLAVHQAIDNLLEKKDETCLKGDCSICLSALFTAGAECGDCDEVVVALTCNDEHVFHRSCLRSWANHNYTCPICR